MSMLLLCTTSLKMILAFFTGALRLEAIWFNPLLKQGHLEQVEQDCVQTAFEYF